MFRAKWLRLLLVFAVCVASLCPVVSRADDFPFPWGAYLGVVTPYTSAPWACGSSLLVNQLGLDGNGGLTGTSAYYSVYMAWFCWGGSTPCTTANVNLILISQFSMDNGATWQDYSYSYGGPGATLSCGGYGSITKYVFWDKTSPSGTRWRVMWGAFDESGALYQTNNVPGNVIPWWQVP